MLSLVLFIYLSQVAAEEASKTNNIAKEKVLEEKNEEVKSKASICGGVASMLNCCVSSLAKCFMCIVPTLKYLPALVFFLTAPIILTLMCSKVFLT